MGVAESDLFGLGDQPKAEWPDTPSVSVVPKRPIELLAPNTERHRTVLDYLLRRLDDSEKEMGGFYSRWRVNEIKYQAYINLPDWEKALEDLTNSGKPPSTVQIIVPTMFSMIMTIVTYLTHTFTGRKPMLQVSTYDTSNGDRARMMEIKHQYDADHTRLIREMIQCFFDAQMYGFFAARCLFRKETGLRTVRRVIPQYNSLGMEVGSTDESWREMRTVYEGNAVRTIDPYMFFPDPRVPMSRVNVDGEFVFWRDYVGQHVLLNKEKQGEYMYVNNITAPLPSNMYAGDPSARSIRSGGRSVAGITEKLATSNRQFRQLDQGTCIIIPKELGLSDYEYPQKWLFSIVNKNQIVQAEPFDADHDRHPVIVSEPYSSGYSFGSLAISDYLGPMQDTSSWLINSHMDNVRKVLNDMLIVDPSMVEMQDLKNPKPGKLIRLKRAAFGQDVRTAVNQLAVQDVTRGHMADLDLFSRLAQQLAAVNENLMGIQDKGGRKTATEVRTSAESAVSRLAAQARINSAQGFCDMTEMMTLNTIQYLSNPFYISVVGKDGLEKSIWISPEMLVGDFYYPVNDGTLPIDRVAMLDVWKEILVAVLGDEELRSKFDVSKMFTYVAELGGAKSIEGMKRSTPLTPPGVTGVPQETIDAGTRSGNMVPVTRGINERQANRALAGVL